jgi:hypothetical protein
VWVDFFSGSLMTNFEYKGEKCDSMERDLNYEHPFLRVSGYERVCDTMEVVITEFKVYKPCHISLNYKCLSVKSDHVKPTYLGSIQ